MEQMKASHCSFHESVARSLEQVQKILDNHRNPCFAENVHHEYQDKYHLVESLTNTAIAALVNAFQQLSGEDVLDPVLDSLKKGKSISLRLAAEEWCEFVTKKKVTNKPLFWKRLASGAKRILKRGDRRGETSESSTEEIVATTVTYSGEDEHEDVIKTTTVKQHKVTNATIEYHWKLTMSYKLFAYASNQPEKALAVFDQQTLSRMIVTRTDQRPFPPRSVKPPQDVSITWLMQQLGGRYREECRFSIDRSAETCRTPRRNEQIDQAVDFFLEMDGWSRVCRDSFLCHKLSGGQDEWNLLDGINADGIFGPILPLMERDNKPDNEPVSNEEPGDVSLVLTKPLPKSPVLPLGDISLFLEAQRKSLREKAESLGGTFPALAALAQNFLVWSHVSMLVNQWMGGVDYIETMLRNQLIAAIGKEVNANDLDKYARFQNRRLLGGRYKPFCHDIRREDHSTDGILTIESKTNDEETPIETLACKLLGDAATGIPINADTSVDFVGDRYLHVWIQHRFESGSGPACSINGRARQFSSFVLMIGTMSGPNQFTPKDAIILQNKDEVMIPLLLEDLPTAKDFKDATSSLSPEQQRFAQSFRSMQLESSLFGLCVIQLKPQLEALLGLPPNALTKEIQLTQDLLSLFIDYQVPSDLLTFDGPRPPAKRDKVAAVKGHVKAVMDMIEACKKKELEAEQQKAEMLACQHDAIPVVVAEPVHAHLVLEEEKFMSQQKGRQLSVGFKKCSASLKKPGRFQTAWGRLKAAPPASVSAAAASQPVPQPAPAPDTTKLTAKSKADDSVGHRNDSRDVAIQETKTEEAPREKNFTHCDDNTELNMASLDVTTIPKKLDALFEANDSDNALRSTIIKTGPNWRRRRRDLLTESKETSLDDSDRKIEKNKAFDLLDALTRGGSLPVACGELHAVVAVAHCFEDSVMDTVICKNVNPIEKLEKSTLMISSAVPTG